MKYKQALKIISEYIHIDDKDGIVMSRQCGKSENVLAKIYHRMWNYMESKFTVQKYRTIRIRKFRNKKGWRV